MKYFLGFLVIMGLLLPLKVFGGAAWKAEVKQRVMNRYPTATRVEIQNLKVQGKVPAGAKVEWMSPDTLLGVVRFGLRGKDRTQVSARAEIEAFAPVVTVVKPIRINESFTGDSVQLEEQRLSPLVLSGVFFRMSDLEGKVARVPLRRGSLVGKNQVDIPFLVRSGQSVQVVHRKGLLEVQLRGTALQRGRHGDWIRVRNPSSNRVLMARVVNAGEVSLQ